MKIIALLICCLCPSLFCLAAAWWQGTPESVLAGTIVGGVVGVGVAISILA